MKQNNILNGFFVIEGLDGAGTTTQAEAVSKKLGLQMTAEPTSGDTGKLLRRCLSGEISVPKSTMAYLFAADRFEHMYGKDGVASRMIQKGRVICDRYLYSSFAYQGDPSLQPLVGMLNDNFPIPQMIIWLDVPVEVCMERLEKRDGKREIYENREYLEQVRARYKTMFSGQPNVLIIDGTLPKETITDIIVKAISKECSI
jgi:dTMP kinase